MSAGFHVKYLLEIVTDGIVEDLTLNDIVTTSAWLGEAENHVVLGLYTNNLILDRSHTSRFLACDAPKIKNCRGTWRLSLFIMVKNGYVYQ